MWKNLFFNVNIIKIWFPNDYLHWHMYVDAHQCPRCMMTLLWCPGCMSTLTDVLDVCWCSPISWMYVDAYWFPWCKSMPTNILDDCRYSQMFLMYLDALRCSGCISMLIDVLDVKGDWANFYFFKKCKYLIVVL